jgi:hypothetical protein
MAGITLKKQPHSKNYSEELKRNITGYMMYYNEHRKHQGIGNQIPLAFLQNKH